MRVLQINVWSGSRYEMNWKSLSFIPFAADDPGSRYQSLVQHIRHHDPDIVCVNESMPCFAFAERLAADVGMDCCVHLGVSGIRLGPLQFPCISEGDAILAKPHLQLEQIGRRSLTGNVLTNQVSFNTDDATQALVAQVTLPSGIGVAICCCHWHASLLDDPATRQQIQDLRAAGEDDRELQQLERTIAAHTEMRKKEALDTAKFAELAASRVAPAAAPIIISGDLNSTESTPEMQLMFERGYSSATKCVAVQSPDADFSTWDPANPQVALQVAAGPERASARGRLEGMVYAASGAERRQLDHVLFKTSKASPKLELLGCEVALSNELGGVVPSDHYGLLADFAVS